MAYVHNYSDGVNRPRLASKGDIAILTSHSAVEETKINMALQYEHVKQERETEMARRYPNKEFIARCDKIMARLLPYYQARQM